MLFTAHFNGTSHEVKIVEEGDSYVITIDKRPSFRIDVISKETGSYSMIYRGRSYEFDVENKEIHYYVLLHGKLYALELINQKSLPVKSQEPWEAKIIAQMPGKIIKIMAKEGQKVAKGEGLVIMEAMKMENELKAPKEGLIKNIKIKEGQNVEAGEELILLE